ncbi:Transposable element Tc1 transposase [Rhizoctonia solani]|uniref:Transposable element Tc1 transposase n=1 Tax=Rhizoctonia solani TaxID=456999 RepID=A0A8H8NSS5_9AGAM|nr:Transposable element Tc1 transposase [Rhizoctonia solani]QRW17567.1 Transposable element Tc1 transposase [Rhizoctonia solani]
MGLPSSSSPGVPTPQKIKNPLRRNPLALFNPYPSSSFPLGPAPATQGPPPAPVVTLAQPPAPSTVKVDHPDTFKGKIGLEAKQWLTCMLAWVRLNQRQFPLDLEVPSFLLMNMTEAGGAWAHPHLDQLGSHCALIQTIDEFKVEFLAAFSNPDATQAVERKITSLTQTSTCAKYITKFHTLQMELDWNDAALWGQFACGLHWEVQRQIATRERQPRTLRELQDASLIIDNALCEERASHLQQGNKSGKTSTTPNWGVSTGQQATKTSPLSSDPNYILEEEQNCQHTEGLCVKCTCDIVANYKKYGSATPRPRPGRPPALSPQTRRSIARYLKLYPEKPYYAIAKLDGTVTERQVQYTANQMGLQRYNNTNQNWDWVAWADESTIDTGEQPVRPKVTRKQGEAYLPKNMVPSFQTGCQSVPMWGCIAHSKKGPLIWLELSPCIAGKKGRSRGGGLTSAGYAEQVLKGPLKEFLDELEAERGHKILIVEDGAPLHKGPQAREARAALGIEQLAHPLGSPDLNAIEPIWRLLKSRVFKVPGARRNADKLWKVAKRVWDELTVEDINKHTGQMDARVQAIKEAEGGPTEF